MKDSARSPLQLLFSFNKLLIFPLCITFIIVNSVTILNYFDVIGYYKPWHTVWSFFYDHGIEAYYYFFDDLGMELSLYHNDKLSAGLVIMMIADVVFSIKSGKKQIVKWILYGIMTVIILFIGFIASPEFYDSV